MDERSAKITIAGVDYELLLTTGAAKEIGRKYGGLGELGDKLMNSDDFVSALDEMIWLIELLINQGVAYYNLTHKDDKKEMITAEMLEILTTPADFASYRDALTQALTNGVMRNVESEENTKNAVTG